MESNDLLELALKKLTDQIREKQAEMTRIHSELQALTAKANKLDEARAIIAHETSAAQSYAMKQAIEDKHGLSLQEEVLECLRSAAVPEGGSSAGDIATMLRAKKYPNSNSKNFYPSVYITLRRLSEKGVIEALAGDKGRLFQSKDATGNLFGEEKNQEVPI